MCGFGGEEVNPKWRKAETRKKSQIERGFEFFHGFRLCSPISVFANFRCLVRFVGLFLAYMSLAEVKASIQKMNVEERLEIAALLAQLNRAEDRQYQAELDRRMAAMDGGRKTDAIALEHLHEKLIRQGR